MSSNLSDEQRNLLIDLVKERRIVYDTNDPNYKNISHKRKAWKDIAKLCKAQETACKTVWKSMRDQYQRYMRSPLNKRRQFRYLSKLSFLEGFTKNTKKHLFFGNYNTSTIEFSIENSPCSSNQHIPYKEESADYQNYTGPIAEKEIENQNILATEYGDNNEEYENEEIISEPTKIFKPSHITEDPFYCNDYFTRNSNSEDNIDANRVSRSANDLCDTITNLLEKYLQNDEDENDLFLKMIGKKMKNLPIAARNRLQQRMLKEVNDEIEKVCKIP